MVCGLEAPLLLPAWVPALGFLKPVSPPWPEGPLGLVATVLPAGPSWAYTMNEVDLQVQTPNHWSLGTYCVLSCPCPQSLYKKLLPNWEGPHLNRSKSTPVKGMKKAKALDSSQAFPRALMPGVFLVSGMAKEVECVI